MHILCLDLSSFVSLGLSYHVLTSPFILSFTSLSAVTGQAMYFVVVCLEPVCAIGMGVAGLFSTTNKDGSWKFKGYSMTSVSCINICSLA